MGLVYSEPVLEAAYGGDLQQLHLLLRQDPHKLHIQDHVYGDTPLIAACRRGNLQVTHFLLQSGADPHLSNKKHRTCLHYVSRRSLSLMDFLMISILMPILLLGYFLLLQKQRRHRSLLQLLLDRGVDVNAVDYKGNTALHYLCLRKNQHLIPLLLQRHASTHLRNQDGETPLDIAVRLKFKKIILLLEKTD